MSKAGELIKRLQLDESREHNCSQHTVVVKVLYTDADPKRRSKIIAGLLIVLAECTDGFCAAKGVEASDLTFPGMKFRFTSSKKVKEFKKRVAWYLHDETIADRLTFY